MLVLVALGGLVVFFGLKALSRRRHRKDGRQDMTLANREDRTAMFARPMGRSDRRRLL